MTAERLRVLVVDDDPRILRLVDNALRQHGFECECAEDGVDAERLFDGASYDAVVADLRMPNRNGHQLLCGLLEQRDRPVLIAHTGVVEPRLARDLIARGVDDILFKPVDLGFLASKIKQQVDRRKRSRLEKADLPADDRKRLDEASYATGDATAPISLSLLNHKLSFLAGILPISGAAIDVYEMTRDCDREVSQIAAAIQRDPSLTAEVLRLANSSLYNSTKNRVLELNQAVARIGQERIGELALAMGAFAAITPDALPWLNVDLTWKRAIAAGIALELMIETGDHNKIESGLVLSTVMHSLGRVALGMLFPNHYQLMIVNCTQTEESLEEQERRIFPMPHTEVLAHLLATWQVPSEVYLPLKFSLDDFRSLVRLSEPARTRTELVKAAIAIGTLAVGRWHDWDLVQLPSPALLARLRIADVGRIINQTRADLQKLIDFHPGGGPEASPEPPSRPTGTDCRCSPPDANGNLLLELFHSMGLQDHVLPAEVFGKADGLSPADDATTVRIPLAFERSGGTVTRTSQSPSTDAGPNMKTIALPCSYGRLRAAVVSASAGLLDIFQ